MSFVDETHLSQRVQWALDHRVKELYLLDPSLNAHPGLKHLLKKISKLNSDRRLEIISEIRAETIDAELAALFAAAGFSWFEIGLQSTNPRALQIMNRPTRLKQFARGAHLLKQNGIVPAIDLIVGLPGDDLRGFSHSLEFVAEHDLADDIQVFPLLVLPGTVRFCLPWFPRTPGRYFRAIWNARCSGGRKIGFRRWRIFQCCLIWTAFSLTLTGPMKGLRTGRTGLPGLPKIFPLSALQMCICKGAG
ncbi:MAG: radical SAM protein [Desulfobacterales bacterium]